MFENSAICTQTKLMYTNEVQFVKQICELMFENSAICRNIIILSRFNTLAKIDFNKIITYKSC